MVLLELNYKTIAWNIEYFSLYIANHCFFWKKNYAIPGSTRLGQMVCTSDVIAVIAAKNVKLYDFYVVEKSPVENGYSTHSSRSNRD